MNRIMSGIKQLGSILDRLMDFLVLLAGVMVLFLIIGVSVDVFMRYFLRRPMIWVDDVSEATLVYIPFLAAAWLLRSDGHIQVDIVFERFSPNLQGMLNVATSILGAGVCLVLAWFTGQATWGSFQHGIKLIGGITYPKYILLAPIPLGCLLLAIQFVRRTYGYLMGWLSRGK